ncbi:long-chain fatty acid-CoA ligase [Sorochytrium milnesiophthora]
MYQKPQGRNVAVELPAQASNESSVYRHFRSKDALKAVPNSDVTTVHDALVYASRVHSSLNGFGSRKLIRVHEEEKMVKKIVGGKETQEKKTWRYFEMEPYSWLTYTQALDRAKAIGAGLIALGLANGDKVCLFASTCADWQLFAHGCFSQNMAIVTAYDTLGTEGLLHALNEPEIPALFCNGDLLSIASQIVNKTNTLRYIVYHGEADQAHIDAVNTTSEGKVRVVSLKHLIEMGKEKPRDTVPPKSSDLCCIMYTSGTTGNPKGVVLTHGNIIAALAGVDATLPGVLFTGDVYLAFLPLAHVLEFVVETFCIYKGISLGYGNPKTLTDASMRNCKGDIKELRPTVMAGVPAVWDTIKKGVIARVSQMPPMVQKVFNLAYKLKRASLFSGLPLATVCDAVVFRKVQEQTGGRLRMALSGGAPISAETQEYLSVVICPVVQGYGMTETCGMCTLYSPETTFELNNAGAPVGCVEIKLVDAPDAGYTTKNTPPQGEVWIRGPSVTSGYFKQPKITAEVLNEDGWLQTGDIGQMTANGTINIIDRKKNLVKLSNGEYIALEKLESIYAGCKFVQRICVYADPLRPFCVAVVQPVPAAIERWARDNPSVVPPGSYDNWEQLCHNKAAAHAVQADLMTLWKSNSLAPADQIKGVVLADEEWTPQNYLTAAQKLKRRDINKAFKEQIDALYK